MSPPEAAPNEAAPKRRGVALLFPGHAALRFDGSVRGFAGTEVLLLLERAAALAGVKFTHVNARPSMLDRVEVFQPMLVALELGIAARIAAAGIDVTLVAGHSLGELSAWSAAGCIDTDEALRIAALRGRLLAREAALHPGGMVAITTSDARTASAMLEVGRRAGSIHFASDSAPDEAVLAGDEAAIRAVIEADPAIAKRVPTGGAWHSPAMAGAVDELRAAHRAAPRSPARAAIVTNMDGHVARDQEALPDILAEQIIRPIAWTRALGTIAAEASAVVIVGPGSVMRALWHRRFRDDPSAPPLFATDTPPALARTIAALR